MHTPDTVSVIMSCYNCEATLEKAIDSILAQSYTDWIMICCDDGSEDRTYELLQGYHNRFPDKFIVFRNERNMHLPYALNRCLEYVSTNYVARMDADDWCLPERFEKQIDYLRSHPDCDLVGTGITVSDGKKVIGSVIRPEEPTKECFLRFLPFSHATIMTYKRVYDRLGGYSLESAASRVEDRELWFRFFAAEMKGYNLQEELYVMREDDNAIRRRTLRSRINSAVISWRGYRLLGFPKWAYLLPLVSIAKGILPRPVYKILHTVSLSLRKQKKQRTASHR